MNERSLEILKLLLRPATVQEMDDVARGRTGGALREEWSTLTDAELEGEILERPAPPSDR